MESKEAKGQLHILHWHTACEYANYTWQYTHMYIGIHCMHVSLTVACLSNSMQSSACVKPLLCNAELHVLLIAFGAHTALS